MGEKQPSIAKITRPSLPAVYLRERLFLLLDGQRHGTVTWIAGPPGAGKTTLAASWLDSRTLPCIWYQCDPGDADLSTFFYYLGMAGKKAAPRVKQPLPLLTPEYLMDVPTFSRRFFEDLCSRVKPPFFIIFDNFQDVPAESAFSAVLASGMAAIPEGVHAVFLSRTEPPPAFSGLIAGSKLEAVGWDELQLTPAESGAIVRLHSPDRQDRRTIEWMHEKTQGWAAGVVLLARAAKADLIEPGMVDALPPEKVFDYFASELFARVDEKVREFLVKSSVLPTMTAAMAGQLTGNSDAGSILDGLARRSYFIFKKSRLPMISYQYHPLFRDFLGSRLRQTLGEEASVDVKKRAAGLLERSGQIEDAAALYTETREWEGLARLVAGHAGSLLVQGRGRTIEEWLSGMPGEAILQDPLLLYWLGIAQMSHDLRASRQRLEQAHALYKKRGDASGQYLSWSGIVETFVYEWSDFRPLDHWISEIGVLLRQHPILPSPEMEARVASAVFCALMYRQPHHTDLPAWEARVRRISESSDAMRLKLTVSSHLVFYYTWWHGDQAAAAMLVNELRSAVRSVEIDPLSKIAWQAIVAACSWMTGDNKACLTAVTEGLRIADETGVHLWDFMLLAQASFATLTAGDLKGARTIHQRMAFITGTGRKLDIAHYHYHIGWEAMCRGDFPLALEHMESGLKAAEETGEPFIAAFIRMGVAEALIELGDRKKAKTHLDEARRTGKLIRSNTVEYQYAWLEAVRCLKEGDYGKALKSLRRHLAVSRELGILNHAAWRSSVMVPLYGMALEEGIESGHVKELVRKRNLMPEQPPLHIEAWPWPVKVYTLGRFRIDVDGRPLEFPGKAQKKPLELLKALIAFGGKGGVSEEQIAEALWPEAEGDHAHKSFEMTLQRLRRILGRDDIVKLQGGHVSLDERYCWTDVRAFEHAAQGAELAVRDETSVRRKEPGGPGRAAGGRRRKTASQIPRAGTPTLLEKAIGLYQGPFLPSDARQPWSIAMRERMRSKFIRLTGAAGEKLEQAEEWAGAADLYEKGLEVDGLAEEFYQRLMLCCRRLGQEARAVMVYHRCRSTLLRNFGIAPSSKTEAIYQQVLRARQ